MVSAYVSTAAVHAIRVQRSTHLRILRVPFVHVKCTFVSGSRSLFFAIFNRFSRSGPAEQNPGSFSDISMEQWSLAMDKEMEEKEREIEKEILDFDEEDKVQQQQVSCQKMQLSE